VFYWLFPNYRVKLFYSWGLLNGIIFLLYFRLKLSYYKLMVIILGIKWGFIRRMKFKLRYQKIICRFLTRPTKYISIINIYDLVCFFFGLLVFICTILFGVSS